MSKGLVLVFTGDGKGKTTAALGTALRMVGHGKRVAMVQFFKSAEHKAQSARISSLCFDPCALSRADRTGELKIFKKLSSEFKVRSFGGGYTWGVSRKENRRAADRAWEKCRRLLRNPKYSLVILDEINIALKYKFLKLSEVLSVLKRKPAGQHVILTGRGAPPGLVKVADLVTEMKCVKHPFSRGIPARPGLDF